MTSKYKDTLNIVFGKASRKQNLIFYLINVNFIYQSYYISSKQIQRKKKCLYLFQCRRANFYLKFNLSGLDIYIGMEFEYF